MNNEETKNSININIKCQDDHCTAEINNDTYEITKIPEDRYYKFLIKKNNDQNSIKHIYYDEFNQPRHKAEEINNMGKYFKSEEYQKKLLTLNAEKFKKSLNIHQKYHKYCTKDKESVFYITTKEIIPESDYKIKDKNKASKMTLSEIDNLKKEIWDYSESKNEIFDANRFKIGSQEIPGQSYREQYIHICNLLNDLRDKEEEEIKKETSQEETKLSKLKDEIEDMAKENYRNSKQASEIINVLEKSGFIDLKNKSINLSINNEKFTDFKPFAQQKKNLYAKNSLFDNIALGFRSIKHSIVGTFQTLYENLFPEKVNNDYSREILNLENTRQKIRDISWQYA